MGRKSKSGSEAFSKTDLRVHKHLRDLAARSLLRLSGDRKPKIGINGAKVSCEMAFFHTHTPFLSLGFSEPGSYS